MYRTLLFLISCLVGATLYAQKPVGTVKGKVLDKQNKLVLPLATATLLNNKDSSVIGFTVSDKNGAFEVKNVAAGGYLLSLSFTGYKEIYRELTIAAEKPVVDLGDIFMENDTAMLASVVVRVPPITVKGDTTEFRAGAFKTKVNATVEDLLKRIPGLEVDRDGNIKSQGKDVPKIYVDGKEFFGNDPKMATRNLTADMVESVQLYEDMSDQAKFNKIDDGSRKKTINIKLKKDRRKGVFGRASAGFGNNDLYEGTLFVNSFNDAQRISVVGNISNTNRSGFGGGMGGGGSKTRGMVMSGMGMGGGGGRGGGGVGNTDTWGGGINFSNDWGKKLSFNASYNVNSSKSVTRTGSYRQSFFAKDSTTFENASSVSNNRNANHNFNMRFDYKIDSLTSIQFTPMVSFSDGSSSGTDSSFTRTRMDGKEWASISRNSQRSNDQQGLNLNSNLAIRRQFHKKGRTLSVNWNSSINNSDGSGSTESPYYFFSKDGDTTLTNQRQKNTSVSKGFNNTIGVSYTEPLMENMLLELNYSWMNDRNTNDVDVMAYSAISGKYDSVDKAQTNYFENKNQHNRFGGNLRYQLKKGDVQIGGMAQFSTLKNMSFRALKGKDTTMVQKFVNLAPNASFNYRFTRTSNMRIGYNGNTRSPQILELQDVRDVSNPLFMREGNPNLKQEFMHMMSISYNKTNPDNFLYYSADLSGGFTSNKIVSNIILLDGGKQLTRPENLNGSFNIALSGNLAMPLKRTTSGKPSPLNLQTNTQLNYNRDVSLYNSQKNFNTTKSIMQGVTLNYWVEKFSVGVTGAFTYNDASLNLQAQTNNRYFNQNYSTDVSYNIISDLRIESSFDYSVYSGRSDGFNQAIPLWDASAVWTIGKKKNAELRFGIVDILNKNSNVNRSITELSIVDTYSQILRRYYMVTFAYGLNRFGGKRTKSATGSFGAPARMNIHS
ncbi:outer membrane beta-barrel protein [Pseudoflavitalea sp. G-6-1-2]|uniref:outer membrane beta-barrel protein n=1 Tax=Pseudoflavitalea sp. G-6-1-2 TaxID=2728841 RepID=UPI00146A8758|nr:outer membrane beta-barrel protein [Pseudoflavitalea sp. G-6-1-2]NML24055.1 outer membrane beta-barrel protein [Pseudoflavitalea sp. G-6-1-2]